LELSHPSAVPSGTGRGFYSSSRHFVPGYFQAVPPGRVAGFIHLPGTSCQATFRLSLRNGSRVLFIFPALRARLLSGCPSGTGRGFYSSSRHFVPGYFQAVPPGRVAGFIHLPGNSCQATFRLSPPGRVAGFIHLPGTSCQGYLQAVPPGRVACFIHLPGTSCQGYFQAVPPGRTFRLCRKVRQASFSYIKPGGSYRASIALSLPPSSRRRTRSEGAPWLRRTGRDNSLNRDAALQNANPAR
jgi:hypothetical protein